MSIVSRFPTRALLFAPITLLCVAPALAQSSENEMVVTSTAHAGEGLTTKSVPVAVGDLNLADGSDYARLNRRLADAADKVCAKDGVWAKFDDIEYSRCRHSAIATAMSHVVSHGAASAVGTN